MIVGDFAQLPPVCGNIAYIRYETSSEIEKIDKQAFLSIAKTFRLQKNFRQQNDEVFQGILERCRYGISTIQDYELIKNQFHSARHVEERFKNAL